MLLWFSCLSSTARRLAIVASSQQGRKASNLSFSLCGSLSVSKTHADQQREADRSAVIICFKEFSFYFSCDALCVTGKVKFT